MKEYEQLELPYPIGSLIIYPVLTKEAVDRLGLNKVNLIDVILRDYEMGWNTI